MIKDLIESTRRPVQAVNHLAIIDAFSQTVNCLAVTQLVNKTVKARHIRTMSVQDSRNHGHRARFVVSCQAVCQACLPTDDGSLRRRPTGPASVLEPERHL